MGGSGAVRISLASEVGDHCFVEVFVLWEICFSIIFPWHVVLRCDPTVFSTGAFDFALIKFL